MAAKVNDIIDGGGSRVRGRPRCARVTSSTSATSRNVLVVNMCGKVRHAIAAVEAGCDIVVAQGTEAGGHTGQIATLPSCRRSSTPSASGCRWSPPAGIVDGRGLAAALALGADGIWVGTRFIATPEANGVPGYKDALLRTHEDGTTITRAYTGKTCRVIENSYTKDFDAAPDGCSSRSRCRS